MRPGLLTLGATLALAVLLLSLVLTSCGMYDGLTRSVESTSPEPAACAECHVEVAAEWNRSAHARSWTAPNFREITSDYRFEECLACHAPRSLFETDGEPTLRAERRDHGVDCQACHLDHGELVGPLEKGGLVRPHAVRVEQELYQSSALCGRCHAGTYEEWQTHAADDERTCQECHMPEVERTVTQATGFASSVIVSLEDRVTQRRHVFDLESIAEFDGSVDVEVSTQRTLDTVSVVVDLTNRLPHLIPTGDFGYRVVKLSVHGSDAEGHDSGSFEQLFVKELGTSLVPAVVRVIQGELHTSTRHLAIRLQRVNRDGEELLLIHGLDREVDP